MLRLGEPYPTKADTAGAVVTSLERFPSVYCPTCKKTQPWFLYVLKGNAYLDRDSADIVCSECKTVLLSLHSDVSLHPDIPPGRDLGCPRTNPESHFKVTVLP